MNNPELFGEHKHPAFEIITPLPEDTSGFTLRAKGTRRSQLFGPRPVSDNEVVERQLKMDVRRSFDSERAFTKIGSIAVNDEGEVVRGADTPLVDVARSLRHHLLAETKHPKEYDPKKHDVLQEAYGEVRGQMTSASKKIGLMNVEPNPDNLSELRADAYLVPYPVYSRFSSRNPLPGQEFMSRLGELTGTSASLITTDNRLIIQKRASTTMSIQTGTSKAGNGEYGGVPGISIGGMMDAPMDDEHRSPGSPNDVNELDFHHLLAKEGYEELAIEPADLTSVVITGVSRDNVKPHTEVMMMARSTKTYDEIVETHSHRDASDLGEADFEEDFTSIDATPEAIHSLLSDIHVPLPPTHVAGLLATGYMLMLERDGKDEAMTWIETAEHDARANIDRINETVRSFYRDHPEAAGVVPERFWGRSVQRHTDGYDSKFTPEEQGLPSMTNELVRTGLIHETRKLIDHVHMFDIDGVLVPPGKESTDHTELFEEIAHLLNIGDVVSLNTGRSTEWALEHIVPYIRVHTTDKSIRNLLVVGEKGNSWSTFLGEQPTVQTSKLELDPQITDRIKHIVKQFEPYVGIFDPKHTMISLMMRGPANGGDVDVQEATRHFDMIAPEIIAKIEAILSEYGLSSVYRVDKTTVAIDIESPYAGKDLGAERLFAFMDECGMSYVNAEITTYGDSASDGKMADASARRSLSTTFVFTGVETDGQKKQTHGVNYVTAKGFDKGTLSYLQDTKPRPA